MDTSLVFIFLRYSFKNTIQSVANNLAKAKTMGGTIRIVFITGIILCLLSLQPKSLFAQNTSNSDSAALMIESVTAKYESNNLDSTYIEARRLLDFSNSASLPFFKGKSKYLLARYFFATGNPDSALYYAISGEEDLKQCNDTLDQGIMNAVIGVIYKWGGDNDKAKTYYLKATELLGQVGDTLWFGVANDHLGRIYFHQGNYILALQFKQKALSAFELLNDSINLGVEHNSIGLVYRKTKDKEKEEEAYLNAIAYLEPLEPIRDLGMAYSNLSEVYLDKDEIEKAFETLEKAKETYEESDFPLGLCSYYAVLSYYYINTKPPQYQKVIENSEKGVAIAEEYGDMRQYADATSFLGTAYMETKQLNKAEQILKKGFAAATDNDYKEEIVTVSEVLAELYNRTNQPQKAFDYLKMYIQLKDSLTSEEKIKEFTSLDLSYKFRQQQLSDSLENVQYRMEREFQHENEIQTQRHLNYFFLVTSLLVIAFAVNMFFARRKLKKANLLLADKNNQISKQNSEIETYAQEVNQAYSKLRELDEYKQAMVSMLVHDLKNPLNVLTNIDVFEDPDERTRIVNHTSKQMLNLVMNMLDVNKAEKNSLSLQLAETNLKDVIQPAITEIDFLCEQKNITIRKEFSNDFLFQADQELLSRVFVNLFSNAIKFSPVNSAIVVDAQVDKDRMLLITVKDEGVGIAREHHQIIFEKFKQIKKIKSGEIASTGLGLAFCKMAVELHGWTIGVDSVPGQGAKFWIRLTNFQTIESDIQNLTIPIPIDDALEYKNISPGDLTKLKPYLEKLNACCVFAISEIKEILINIEALNIEGLDRWLEEIRFATIHIDEAKFIGLIKVLMR